MEAAFSEAMIDRAKGCIMGSLIGDACGAPLEFTKDINKNTVEAALDMKGGGIHGVTPDQITDDGQLTMCVLQGLTKCKNGYDPEIICIEYGRWINSKPFDVGGTTRHALFKASSMKGKLSERVTNAAKEKAESTSNGSTMKLSPTAAYCAFISDTDKRRHIVTVETQHVHASKEVIDCNIVFSLAIRDLIRGESSEKAYQNMKAFALTSTIKE